ncbi:MAG: NAD(+) synthase [Clostridia bacterium]|nr:NAD(+) synthase [Clostridia bacterium]
MRDYKEEVIRRVEFIKNILSNANAKGVVFGNSGGKDSALVGILCKMACENTVGVIMPCGVSANYQSDKEDALKVAKQFDIETREIDLMEVKQSEIKALETVCQLTDSAKLNIAPRLRMTTLYAIGAAENRLVAGTSNRSEFYVGYFTKWGDGACDFNPIADLTATEVLAFLKYLGAPSSITDKAPSAGLKEDQTDEKEMGVSYATLDRYITTGECIDEREKAVIDRLHKVSHHKRHPIKKF